MNIKPITNEDEHAEALKLVDALLDAEEGTPEAHTCDALVTLIDAYEVNTWPLDNAFDPIGLLQQAMSPEVGHTRTDLIKIIGSASRVSEILAKKRALTIDMIRSISDAWGIPAELLLQKYEIEAPTGKNIASNRVRLRTYVVEVPSDRPRSVKKKSAKHVADA